MRDDLPTGTVTFLFTDVEGSTKLLHELGAEAYASALAEHRRVVREICAEQNGGEVDTQGDAFFIAFPTAPAALEAARRINERLTGGPIRLRIGLHTGTPLVTQDGYVGPDVHRAARIASAGHGGQILVSSATVALVDLEVRDLGEHRLKDLSAPERIFQLGDNEFPRLKSLYQTNLPVPANSLVDRKRELVDVLSLLSDGTRVVSVTGPGGVGKTRFSLAAAGEAADRFPDGVWFVALAPLRDPQLVLPSIAKAVGAEADLLRHVAGLECLLLLDNFESVIGAASDIAALAAAAPSVRMLVTSREPLRIAVEREYRLRPLPESPAVELFRQRADAAAADIDVPYEVAVEICDRLDRLPLAIELAAARVTVFEPDVLLERLERRLPLLVSRARDIPERQRTLHSTIAWSYELLEPMEQRLFRRLAVFRGGATLEAVERVAEGDAELVESLVDKSLLRRRGRRFFMLETIREFALEELAASDDAVDTRHRHATYFLEVADSGNLNAGTRRPGGQRLEIAIAEQDNVRAALGWALEGGNKALGLDLALAMDMFWVVNDPSEALRWYGALFDLPADVDPTLRAEALRSYASAYDLLGDQEIALQLYEESLRVFDELGDEHGRAVLLHRLGIHAMRRGELERARALVEQSHALHERRGDTWGLAQTVGTVGAIERDAGNVDQAYALLSESAGLAEANGAPWWQAGMLIELAALSLEAGRLEDADLKAREALDLAQRLRDYGGRVFGVGVLACVAAQRAELNKAGRLWGAIEVHQVGAPLGGWLRHRAACEAYLTEHASPELELALAAGRELSLDDAVELALGNVRPNRH